VWVGNSGSGRVLLKPQSREVGNLRRQKLISQVQGVIPANLRVIVAADRGLYADWLYQLIESVGPHPFLRINHQGTYRLPSSETWQPLAHLVRQGGQSWSGEVLCFKTNPLSCTLLARWDLDYKDPWLILTDFKPEEANVLALWTTFLYRMCLPRSQI